MNKIINDRLKLQAEQAERQGMIKLAKAVNEIVVASLDKKEYSYSEMNDEIHKDLWKIASKLITYYDLNNIDIEKMNSSLVSWAETIIDDIERTLEVDNVVKGPLEVKLFGEE